MNNNNNNILKEQIIDFFCDGNHHKECNCCKHLIEQLKVIKLLINLDKQDELIKYINSLELPE
jgi:hypothetical protein